MNKLNHIAFIMDGNGRWGKKKVQDVLKELSISDLKVKEFYRLKIGE